MICCGFARFVHVCGDLKKNANFKSAKIDIVKKSANNDLVQNLKIHPYLMFNRQKAIAVAIDVERLSFLSIIKNVHM